MNTIAEVPLPPAGAGEVAQYHGEYTTAHIVTRLFPLPTLGEVFFNRFIEHARSNQDALPDEPESVAIIRCDSIAVLGKELGLSNDTTHKYVTLYIALGLLTKRKLMGTLYFVLSLGIYHAPETLAANLDYHIQHSITRKSRNKFHQLFVDVKERCLVYGLIASDFPQTLSRLNALLEPVKGESRIRLERRIEQSHHILSTLTADFFAARLPHHATQVDSLHVTPSYFTISSTHDKSRVDSVIPTQAQTHAQQSTLLNGQGSIENSTHTASTASSHTRLPNHTSVDARWQDDAKNLPTSITQVDAQPQAYPENLPDFPVRVDGKHIDQSIESTLMAQSGRRESSPSQKNLPTSGKRVDALLEKLVAKSTPSAQSGRRDTHSDTNLPTSNAQGRAIKDEKSTRNAEEGRRNAESTPENLPDASIEVDSSKPVRNVNVDSIYNYITFTLRNPVALSKFFAIQFENDESVHPKYRKLLRTNDGQPRSPHQLVAAYICTQVRNYCGDWEMKKPGGYFTQRCRDYDTGVPEEVEEMIRIYGSIPVAQFIEKLKQEAQEKQTQQGNLTQATKTIGKPMPEPLAPPLHLLPTTKIERHRATMSLEEANQLIETILDKGRSTTFRAARVRIGKEYPHFVVLVDAAPSVSYERQAIIYTPQEWQQGQQDKFHFRSFFPSKQQEKSDQ